MAVEAVAEDVVSVVVEMTAVVSEAVVVVLSMVVEEEAPLDEEASVDLKVTEIVSAAETITIPVTEVEKEEAVGRIVSAAVAEAAEDQGLLPVAEEVLAVLATNSMARDAAQTDSEADHPDLEICINDKFFATTRRLVLFD